MRKITFAEGQVYHIYNRGTERREIFSDDHDRQRFVNDLYYLNNSNTTEYSGESIYRQLPESGLGVVKCLPTKIVDILAFVLMPNHYHLILAQKVPGGISEFMHKLGTAYTMYFNKRYQHSGVLYQGRFKAILLKRENHFNYLPFYIHANPLKLYPDSRSISDKLRILASYKWSSYRDYAGISNFPSVISPAFLNDFFESEGGFVPYMVKYLENRQKLVPEAQPPEEAEPRDKVEA